jgi:hypothetical protein
MWFPSFNKFLLGNNAASIKLLTLKRQDFLPKFNSNCAFYGLDKEPELEPEPELELVKSRDRNRNK